VRSVQTGAVDDGTVNVTKPTGTASGDRLVAIVWHDEGLQSVTTPSGFTLVGSSGFVSNRGQGDVYEKIAGGSEPSSYSFASTATSGSGGTSGCVHLFALQDIPADAELEVSFANGAASNTHTAPAVASYTGDDPLVIRGFMANTQTASSTYSTSTPTGYTSRGIVTPPFNWIRSYAASAQLSGHATVGTAAATLTSTSKTWSALTVVIPTVVEAASVDKSGSDSGTGSDSGSVAATTTAPADSGTGSESGELALLQSGSDSGSGSEDGFVAMPATGADSGSGDDDGGSVAADTAGSDTGTGGSTGTVAATLTATADAGDGSEAGYITLPGTDSATSTDALVSLDADVAGDDEGTGSSGGYVETLYADLDLSLFAIDPDTGDAVALPDFTRLDQSRERNGPGAITVGYPVTGLNFELLRSNVVDGRDVEVELRVTGSAVGAMRGYLQEAAGDDVAENAVWTFAGGFAELRMGDAVIENQPVVTTTTVTTTVKNGDNDYTITVEQTISSESGSHTTTTTQHATSGSEGTQTQTTATKGELFFSAATPGEIMTFLMGQATDRGALTDITLGFSDTHDSGGTEWPNVVSTKFSPGGGYDKVLGNLVDLGVAEWAITWTGSELQLDMWAPEGRGSDLTTGARPVVLRKARNLTEAPRKWSVRDAGTAVLAAGAEGVYQQASDPTALARRGRRIERYVSANNLSDAAAVQAFAQKHLGATTTGLLEVTHGLAFLPGEPRPVIAFNIGDWVYSQTGTSLDRLRVVQWTLSFDASQGVSGSVTLNDSIRDAVSRLLARLNALQAGDTVVGTSSASTGLDDDVAPGAPTDLVADSIAYQDEANSETYASVTVGWTAPTLNVDGTAATDIAGYRVQYAYLGTAQVGPPLTGAPDPVLYWYEPTPYQGVSDTEFTFAGVGAGVEIGIRVAAFDNNGNQGPWSDRLDLTTEVDNTPPPVPGEPDGQVWFRTLNVVSSGLGSEGEPMPFDWLYNEVWLSQGSTILVDEGPASTGPLPFDPEDSDAQHVANIVGAGATNITDLPVGVSWYVALRSVDRAGNASATSATAGPFTAEQLVSQDLIDEIIDANKLGPDSVESQHVVNGAITSAKIVDAAIVTAKIADLAVNDAKIETLSVGKITSGTTNSTIVIGTGQFRTAAVGSTGARSEWDTTSLRFYNSSNTMTIEIKGDGNALITGTIQSALSGQRWNMTTSGELRLYPSAGSNYSRVWNLGSGIAMRGPVDGNGRSGRINADSSGVGINFSSENDLSNLRAEIAVFDRLTSFIAPLHRFYINEGLSSPDSNPRRISFGKLNSSGSDVAASTVWFTTDGSNNPAFLATGANAGVKFESAQVSIVNGDGTQFGPCKASSFPTSSTSEAKTDIVDTRHVLDPRDVFRTARSMGWRRVGRGGKAAASGQLQFGPIAEDLPPELVYMTPKADGSGDLEPSVDLVSQIGVIWARLCQLEDQEIRYVHGSQAITDVWEAGEHDVPILWDEEPLDKVRGADARLDVGAAWQGKATARVLQDTVTDTGCTVRVTTTARIAVTDARPLTVHAAGAYLYDPPFQAAPVA